MPDQPAVVTRFAPSPTGHLHIGGARTALFCWALAHKAGHATGDDGRFLLRIEDTDQKRSTESAAAGILADLAWLGIRWHEGPEFADAAGPCGGDPRNVGPFSQSQRLELYTAEFDKLVQAGLAYPAFDTPDELNAMRQAAEKDKRSFIYRQPDGYDHTAAVERAKTEEHVLRFKMPEQDVALTDEILGEITFPYAELDDPIIRKRDGFPTYHFAVVVDDAHMGVTHVLRGQEHLNNTPKHIQMFRAIGAEPPAFAHLPIITNPDGSKMSKRDKDKAVRTAVKDAGGERPLTDGKVDRAPAAPSVTDAEFAGWLKDKKRQLPPPALRELAAAIGAVLPEVEVEDFRAAGYLPEVVTNFIALLGWSPGEKDADGKDLERFTMTDLARLFELSRVGRSSAKFDREKLLAFNADTIQHTLTDAEFADRWRAWAAEFDPALIDEIGAERWGIAAEAARPRCKTLADARAPLAFALTTADAIEYDPKAVKKVLRKGEPTGLACLAELPGVLAGLADWEPAAIDAALAEHAETSGHGMKLVAQPLRVAIAGAAVSPPLGLTLALIGRDETMARIERCLAAHAES